MNYAKNIRALTRQLMSFIRKEPVLTAAGVLAVISVFFVPPDAAYIQYIDFKTPSCLLCLMIALKGIAAQMPFSNL